MKLDLDQVQTLEKSDSTANSENGGDLLPSNSSKHDVR